MFMFLFHLMNYNFINVAIIVSNVAFIFSFHDCENRY